MRRKMSWSASGIVGFIFAPMGLLFVILGLVLRHSGTVSWKHPEDPACTQDALRAALTAMRPALSRMSRKQRKKACADIAARLRAPRKGSDRTPRGNGNPMDLGKKIMASRNPNYRH